MSETTSPEFHAAATRDADSRPLGREDLRTFALATLIGISPGAFIYASAGAGVETVVAAHQEAKEACLVAGGIAQQGAGRRG